MPRRAALLLPLVLLACARPGPADQAEALQDALASHQANLAAAGFAPAPAAPRPATRQVAAAASRAPSPGTPGTAAQLLGQTPDAVLQWLGEPRLRREEGPAEIWHYQATQCHLDLVLYRDDASRPTLRVAFAQARSVGTARSGEAACLSDIARGAARPGPSGEPAPVG